jgi:hypothetical protein
VFGELPERDPPPRRTAVLSTPAHPRRTAVTRGGGHHQRLPGARPRRTPASRQRRRRSPRRARRAVVNLDDAQLAPVAGSDGLACRSRASCSSAGHAGHPTRRRPHRSVPPGRRVTAAPARHWPASSPDSSRRQMREPSRRSRWRRRRPGGVVVLVHGSVDVLGGGSRGRPHDLGRVVDHLGRPPAPRRPDDDPHAAHRLGPRRGRRRGRPHRRDGAGERSAPQVPWLPGIRAVRGGGRRAASRPPDPGGG